MGFDYLVDGVSAWAESVVQAVTVSNTFLFLSILFVLANVKSILGIWHCRIFRALFSHLVLHRSRHVDVLHQGGQLLFQPVVSSSHSPLLECDFNGHKSNSTFYSDLDVSRMHLLCALFKDVLSPGKKSETAPKGLGKLNIALGGVSCTFKREIKPYEQYEMWSKVLCWDEKWIYIVSHFVRKGVVKPKGYTLQTRQTKYSGKSGIEEAGKDPVSDGHAEQDTQKLIYASAISKYVFKSGRRTVSPQEVLQKIDLVPLPPLVTANGTLDAIPSMNDTSQYGTTMKVPSKHQMVQANGAVETEEDSRWGWDRVDQQRRQGMEIARHFSDLDGLHGCFSGSSDFALGHF